MADLDRVRACRLMREAGIDALVLFQPEHVAYAIGAGPGVATMWRRAGGAVALVPQDPYLPVTALIGDLNAVAVARAAPDVDVRAHRIWVDSVDLSGLDTARLSTQDLLAAGYARATDGAFLPPRPATFDFATVLGLLGEALHDRGLSSARLGVDLGFLPAADYAVLTKALPGPVWEDGTRMVLQLRAIKSTAEIDRLGRACALAEAGLVRMIEDIRVGRSQKDLSGSWRGAVAAARADARDLTGSWDYISVGPDPWSSAGTISRGALIKADVGCLIEGYSSDTARTFVCGTPDPHASRIFAVLEEAFETGFSLLMPGAVFADIHAATLRVIHAAGFNDYSRGHFGHSLGADVGIEEWPFISADAQEIVEPGMVLAFETPFYGTGLGALMIEDQLLVTTSGPQIMNQLARGLRQLPG